MGTKLNFLLNEKIISTEINQSTVVLDFIRNDQNLTCTKEGCREGDCGACTILVGTLTNGKLKYHTANSCIMPLANVNLKHVVTLEGLTTEIPSLLQNCFADLLASQCGFCTPGFIVALTGYFMSNQSYEVDGALNAVAGNICRCTGYGAIKRSVEKIINSIVYDTSLSHCENLVVNNVIPICFKSVENELNRLNDIHSNVAAEHKPDEIIVGGGTDLYVQKRYAIDKSNILNINSILNKRIYIEDDLIHISGTATFEDIKTSKIIANFIPDIQSNLELIASLPIRNSATVAGNLINASPIGDFTIIFLALGAEIKLTIYDKSRIINLSELYKCYKELTKLDEEILEEIIIKIPNKNILYNFEKVSKRTYLDIASVNSASVLEVKDKTIINANISAGGVSPIPLLLKEANSFLMGKEISIENIYKCCEIALTEISPISDIRGSKKYKEILLQQLIKAHFIKLFPKIIDEEELI